MRIRLKVIYILLGSLIIVGCDKDVVVPHFNGFADDYFHMRKNTTWVYQVDSVYNDNGRRNLTTYFEKHIVVDSIVTTDALTISVQVYRSDDSISGFILTHQQKFIFSEYNVKLIGPDVHMIVMEKPLLEGHKWYSQNDLCNAPGGEIQEILPSLIVHGMPYDSVYEVLNCWRYVFDFNHIHRSYYSRGVGLIKDYENRTQSGRFGDYSSYTTTKEIMSYAY